MLVRPDVGIVVMFGDCHYSKRRVVMPWSTRRFDDSSHALHGQNGDYEPKQKCLEDAIHLICLAHEFCC
jgi:hypothetical protein